MVVLYDGLFSLSTRKCLSLVKICLLYRFTLLFSAFRVTILIILTELVALTRHSDSNNKRRAIGTEQSKRERLLTAVRDLVLENGIQGSSMSKISKAAALPMGTIYAMYPTKEDLINAAYVFCRENYMGSILFPQIHDDTGWEEAIKEAVYAYIDSAVAHDKDFLFVEQCYLNPVIRPEILSDQEDILGEVGMREIINGNSSRKRPVYLVQHLALAVIHKSINLYLTGRISLDEDTKGEIARICWSILQDFG